MQECFTLLELVRMGKRYKVHLSEEIFVFYQRLVSVISGQKTNPTKEVVFSSLRFGAYERKRPSLYMQ